MAKGTRGRRRNASRQCRTTPYSMLTCQHKSKDPNEHKSSIVMHTKDWEDITCSVCMEYPHNAVLLLCSSHDKGCRPYMCGTSSHYSNCLDQYKNACTKVTSSPHHSQSLQTNTDQISGWPVEKCGGGSGLSCPLCRGQVKGWTVVESAREYLNAKNRMCMHDDCSFVGGYKEMKKHVRSEHPFRKPREVDPDQEQRWRRLVRERERDDVFSIITSSLPGSMVFGDYAIERNNDDRFETSLVHMLLLFRAFGPSGNTGGFTFGGTRRRNDVGGRISDDDDADHHDDDDDGDGNGDDNNGMSLANRLRRQGRVLLGRSGRRRRNRVVNRGQV